MLLARDNDPPSTHRRSSWVQGILLLILMLALAPLLLGCGRRAEGRDDRAKHTPTGAASRSEYAAKTSYLWATVTLAGEALYATLMEFSEVAGTPLSGHKRGLIVAYRLDEGLNQQWVADIGLKAALLPVVVRGEFVYALVEGTGDVVKLRCSDGELEWRANGAFEGGGASPGAVSEEALYVVNADGHVVAISLDDGASTVVYAASAQGSKTQPRPSASANREGLNAIDSAPEVSSALGNEGPTGAIPLTRASRALPFVAVAGERLIIAGADGTVTCLSDDTERKALWEKHLGQRARTRRLACTEDRVVACTETEVYCLAANTGDVFWSRSLGEIYDKPHILGELVYIGLGSRGHELVALALDSGRTAVTYPVPESKSDVSRLGESILVADNTLVLTQWVSDGYEVVKVDSKTGEFLDSAGLHLCPMSPGRGALATDGTDVFILSREQLVVWRSSGVLERVPPPTEQR